MKSPTHSTPVRDLLVSLGTALDRVGEPHGRLVLMARPRLHARSAIYFVGDASQPECGCQWVVKRPNEQTAQEDLASPLDAQRQFDALRRLATHFESVAPALRISRPVAFLEEVAALAIEYVKGTPVDRLVRPRRLVEPEPLLQGITLSARFLHHLHAFEPRRQARVSPWSIAQQLLALADDTMRPAGLVLPPELRAALEAVPRQDAVTECVRLHGDFAAVNMLIHSGTVVTGIDIGLTEIGTPEDDLARFLMMLETQRLFLAGADVPRVRAFRHRAERALIESYYGDASTSLLLELRVTQQLCKRWLQRHRARLAGNPVLRGVRSRVVDRYFESLLRERASAIAAGPETIVAPLHRTSVLLTRERESHLTAAAPVAPAAARGSVDWSHGLTRPPPRHFSFTHAPMMKARGTLVRYMFDGLRTPRM
jgi:aminoglycoside phosphotransferase (APT) family kinase protein